MESSQVKKNVSNFNHEFLTFKKNPDPTLIDFSPVIAAWEAVHSVINDVDEEGRLKIKQNRNELIVILKKIIEISSKKVQVDGDDSTAKAWLGNLKRFIDEESPEVKELKKKLDDCLHYFTLLKIFKQSEEIYRGVKHILDEEVRKEYFDAVSSAWEKISAKVIECESIKGKIPETDVNEIENKLSLISEWKDEISKTWNKYRSQMELTFTLGISGQFKETIQRIEAVSTSQN